MYNEDIMDRSALEKIMERLPDYLDMSDVDRIDICESEKNNGVIMPGIRVRYKSTPIMPCIYPPSFFSLPPDLAAKRAADEIEKRLEAAKALYESGELTTNWRNRVFISLVHYEMNKKMLKSCIYRKFFDLAAVVRWYIPLAEDGGVMLCPKGITESLGVTEEEFFQEAKRNTRRLFTPESENLAKYLARYNPVQVEEEEEDEIPIYILTHSGRTFGAVMMIYPDVLKELAEEMHGSYFLIPSSVHEVLALPADEKANKDALREIVSSVNETSLDKTEILSYTVYYYDEKSSEISVFA